MLFCFDHPEALAGWAAIDDRVMGGVSRSRMRHAPAGHAVFEGQLSLAQGGGFASVRARTGTAAVADAVDATAALIEVRGVAQRYKLTLFTADGADALGYQHDFVPDADRWTLMRLPLADFVARFRGREVPGAPALDAARLRQVGLMIAGRQAGPFALDLRSITLA
ncbi:MAG: CIA30 family protein [Aquabacterium sp.]|nr:CIA30 family protein [Aquabacterium sp.]